jgi:hypothetical protein
MSDYRVYDTRGARARSRSVTPRRERDRPSREAVMERGRRLKRASHRVALLCFAAFAVLAGLRAGPSGASSPSASQQRRHHRTRRHVHARHTSTTRTRSASSTPAAAPAPASSSSNLAPQQTSEPPVVQSSGS